jgi:hypothetical protein
MNWTGCCGVDTPHVHLCYFGMGASAPAAWLLYRALAWWRKRQFSTGDAP